MSKRYLPADSAARKKMPMCKGLVDYFPDALLAIAEVSWLGNEKHNLAKKFTGHVASPWITPTASSVILRNAAASMATCATAPP